MLTKLNISHKTLSQDLVCSSKQAIEVLGRTCTDTERIQMNDWRASPATGVNKSRSSALLALVLAVFPLLLLATLLLWRRPQLSRPRWASAHFSSRATGAPTTQVRC